MPGRCIWQWCPNLETTTEFAIVEVPSDTPQGWYDPLTGEFIAADHDTFYQYNFIVPKAVVDTTTFVQEEGTIYWLEICMDVEDPVTTNWGWKSSQDHWEDDAVWRSATFPIWQPLYEPPDFTQTLDLAFVVTGGRYVPTVSPWGLIVLALLVVSAAGVIALRRARRAPA
jgi:hypothetical protein